MCHLVRFIFCVISVVFGSNFEVLTINKPFYIVSTSNEINWYNANITCNKWYNTYLGTVMNDNQNDLIQNLMSGSHNAWIGWYKTKTSIGEIVNYQNFEQTPNTNECGVYEYGSKAWNTQVCNEGGNIKKFICHNSGYQNSLNIENNTCTIINGRHIIPFNSFDDIVTVTKDCRPDPLKYLGSYLFDLNIISKNCGNLTLKCVKQVIINFKKYNFIMKFNNDRSHNMVNNMIGSISSKTHYNITTSLDVIKITISNHNIHRNANLFSYVNIAYYPNLSKIKYVNVTLLSNDWVEDASGYCKYQSGKCVHDSYKTVSHSSEDTNRRLLSRNNHNNKDKKSMLTPTYECYSFVSRKDINLCGNNNVIINPTCKLDFCLWRNSDFKDCSDDCIGKWNNINSLLGDNSYMEESKSPTNSPTATPTVTPTSSPTPTPTLGAVTTLVPTQGPTTTPLRLRGRQELYVNEINDNIILTVDINSPKNLGKCVIVIISPVSAKWSVIGFDDNYGILDDGTSVNERILGNNNLGSEISRNNDYVTYSYIENGNRHCIFIRDIKDDKYSFPEINRLLRIRYYASDKPLSYAETFTYYEAYLDLKAVTLDPTMHPSNIPTLEPSKLPTLTPTKDISCCLSSISQNDRLHNLCISLSMTECIGPNWKGVCYYCKNCPESDRCDSSTITTLVPSELPTKLPSKAPTNNPTSSPTSIPSFTPSKYPSLPPTRFPSENPSYRPTLNPSYHPTSNPSGDPTLNPSHHPTSKPSYRPTSKPSRDPTSNPTHRPTSNPSYRPTSNPTRRPTPYPSHRPTRIPTKVPTNSPSYEPTPFPTQRYSTQTTRTPCDCTASSSSSTKGWVRRLLTRSWGNRGSTDDSTDDKTNNECLCGDECEGDDCPSCLCEGKATTLTFENWGSNKKCTITDGCRSKNTLYDGWVYHGTANSITVIGQNSKGTLSKKIKISCDDGTYEELKTDCSTALYVGLELHDVEFRIVDGESSKNGPICQSEEAELEAEGKAKL